MIGKLSGIVDSLATDHLILDVQGVGYSVFCSARTLANAHKAEPLSLLIDTHVREDHIHLFGFLSAAEQQWFRLLTSVQGVGAKAGMAILSACPADKLGFIIAAQDKAALTQADGIGPKIAVRILTELKDKASKIDLAPAAPKGAKIVSIDAPDASVDNDAVSALINLGYARADAYQAVMQAKTKANDNEAGDVGAMIRLALKELSA
jgi:holliday junction DNA helicase RuvA